jgi:hypothetical protein
MSASAARPVSPIVPSTSTAFSGFCAATNRPPSACAMITESEWATTSCISRAMRARSSATASAVRCSRSRTACSARSRVRASWRTRARCRFASAQTATIVMVPTTIRPTKVNSACAGPPYSSNRVTTPK